VDLWVVTVFTKICVGCQNPFDTDNIRRTRCVKNCGRSHKASHEKRDARREEHIVEFIGVDGEGVTREDGTHDYVLLSVGDTSLARGGRALHHDEIFEFLYEQFELNPTAAYVGFFLGYDFTQWVKTLPRGRAWYLLHKDGIAKRTPQRDGPGRYPWPVNTDWWEFDILADKRFKLRPRAPQGAEKSDWMYICDAGPFFQTSFLSVLDPKAWPGGEPPIPREQYELILEGKNHRATAQYDNAMVRYNVAENQALSVVMDALNRGFVDAGVRLKRNQWFGPGQAAAGWLAQHSDHYAQSSDEHLGLIDIVPHNVLNAGRASYYGGWFEIFCHGLIPGDAYEYDVNSAYPFAISQLPCLLHGTWTETVHPETEFSLCEATIIANSEILGSLPSRTEQGQIYRSYGTTGTYWRHEIEALCSIPGLVTRVKYTKSYNYHPCNCPPPLRDIAELYLQRVALGEEGKNSPAGKSRKLLYNSVYGKLCQSVGQPKYANPIWASYITSHCRTMILNAIATHPTGMNDLLMVATDGVYFRTPHTGLHLSPTELGAWDETRKSNMTLFMPGIYWDDKTRAALAAGTAPKLKSRGISAAALALCVNEIDRQFAGFSPTHDERDWPKLEVPLAFTMVSAKQAITRHQWATAGKVRSDETKTLDSWPITKRDPSTAHVDVAGLIRCKPYYITQRSIPYSRSFGMDLDVLLTPDGDASSLLFEMLK
jgi:hypothetical protein